MPNTYSISDYLGIEPKNIHFKDVVHKMYFRCIQTLFYEAVLTYEPKACEACGIVNENHTVVKNGKRKTLVYMGQVLNRPAYMKLAKQRFYCKECHQSFTARSPYIQPKSSISSSVKLIIAEKAAEVRSEKAIAEDVLVSPSTVHRQLKVIAKQVKPKVTALPSHLAFDEFKSTRDVSAAMSFIYCDAETHEIIDILPDRRRRQLTEYFSRFSLETRSKVKTVSIDMYEPYMGLIEEMFPNAQIIIDRFHIIQAVNREINRCRVSYMNAIRHQHRPQYTKLKRYWRLFLKNPNDLDAIHYYPYQLFKQWQSQYSIIAYLLSLDEQLTQTYYIGHSILNALRSNDYDSFLKALDKGRAANVSKGLKRIIRTLKKYSIYIQNTIDRPHFTNGPIEGINNKIKLIKRTAYGYRNFINFRNRILIISKLFVSPYKAKIKQQNNVA